MTASLFGKIPAPIHHNTMSVGLTAAIAMQRRPRIPDMRHDLPAMCPCHVAMPRVYNQKKCQPDSYLPLIATGELYIYGKQWDYWSRARDQQRAVSVSA